MAGADVGLVVSAISRGERHPSSRVVPFRNCRAQAPGTEPFESDSQLALLTRDGSVFVAGAVFLLFFILNNMARFVFSFVFGSFFPQVLIFSNFSASFSGSFRFAFQARSCVFNNFSGSFFKITSFFVPFVPKSKSASLFPGRSTASRVAPFPFNTAAWVPCSRISVKPCE